MGFNRILQWLLPVLMSLFLVTGCGDLEPEMQDTRTVILKMDFDQRSSSRSSSRSPSELIQYNTHLILAVKSTEELRQYENGYSTSIYSNNYSMHAQGLVNTENNTVSLKIPFDTTQMKIFAFLFRDTIGLEDFISGDKEVGNYGESQSFLIGDSGSISVDLKVPEDLTATGGASQVVLDWTAVSGATSYTVYWGSATGVSSSSTSITSVSTDSYTHTGLYDGTTYYYKVAAVDSAGTGMLSSEVNATTFTTGGSGDYGNTDTTAPVIETVTAVTTPTSDSTPDYTFSSTETGLITYGGPCATSGSATTNAIVGHNLIIFNTLSDGSYINCTITVTDPAGNESTTLQIPDFTVQTISTLPAPDNLTASGTSTSVTLKWNAVTDASSYTLYWDNVSGIDSSDNTFNNITNDNYTHNNLVNGTTYYYKVAAVNSSGTVTLSSEKIYITNLWDGMVAHYSFNGNANNVKANYNGTVSGATLSRGRGNDNNTAYSFDGVDDYIDFGSGILSGNGSFTIVVWINSTDNSSRILQQRDAQGFNGQYMLDILDNGSIKFNTYYYGFKWNVTSSSALNDGSWHHLAFVQKDNDGQMYLNGILEQTDNTGGKVNLTSSLKTYIGGDLRDNYSYYSGKIDDLKIYSRALSVSEIQTLHNIID
jgi:fibronectin type 3 domain-containing protein